MCNPDLKHGNYLFHFFEVIVELGSFCPSNLLTDFLEGKEGTERETVHVFTSEALQRPEEQLSGEIMIRVQSPHGGKTKDAAVT